MYSKLAAISAFVVAAKAQQACTLTTETKPSITWETCTSAGSCTSNTGGCFARQRFEFLLIKIRLHCH